MIDLTIDQARLDRAVERARERRIIIPTLAQQCDPNLIPDQIKADLRQVGLWDMNSLNLFRITWKNEPVSQGGGFGRVNYLEFPSTLTGAPARIIALVGKWFPTGAHKVGAAFGCLVPRLVTGQFDPTSQKAVWPSTGNYCRGGAYDSVLLGCRSIAILPEGMSQERFDWLQGVADEIIATPGSESNVKEIFDKCNELRRSGQDLVIFNQFDEMGNHLWHYSITGPAIAEVLEHVLGPNDTFAGSVFTTGSAGTIGCGDYLKNVFPSSKLAASEALQCPTLLNNGFGAHRIEGIGDKHIPWVHNLRQTDMVMAIDDAAPVNLIRLFNEPEGRRYLCDRDVPEVLVNQLDLLGISGVANLLSAIKMAKYYELDEQDVLVTVLTDSMELYGSRLRELNETEGAFTTTHAAEVFHRYLLGTTIDHLEELTYAGRKRIHNLKYFTWVEQQGKPYEELQAQWHDRHYWTNIHCQADEIDELITEFNRRTGLLV
jgi:cysteine synthase